MASLNLVLGQYVRSAVLFSGGYDSEVLLRASVRALGKESVLPVTASSVLLADYYRQRICRVCAELGLEPVFLEIRPLEDAGFVRNDEERCYLCKRMICRGIREEAESRGFAVLTDGANLDDLAEFRPGMRAADEAGVQHPFLQAGMDRLDISRLGRRLGTLESEHPSDSCLATRIPHGREITADLIQTVRTIEEPLRPGARGRLRAVIEEGGIRLDHSREDRDLMAEFRDEMMNRAAARGLKIRFRELGN